MRGQWPQGVWNIYISKGSYVPGHLIFTAYATCKWGVPSWLWCTSDIFGDTHIMRIVL